MNAFLSGLNLGMGIMSLIYGPDFMTWLNFAAAGVCGFAAYNERR